MTIATDHSFRTCAKSSENLNFLLPDTHTYVCMSGGKKCKFSEDFAYVLIQWSLSKDAFKNFYKSVFFYYSDLQAAISSIPSEIRASCISRCFPLPCSKLPQRWLFPLLRPPASPDVFKDWFSMIFSSANLNHLS